MRLLLLAPLMIALVAARRLPAQTTPVSGTVTITIPVTFTNLSKDVRALTIGCQVTTTPEGEPSSLNGFGKGEIAVVDGRADGTLAVNVPVLVDPTAGGKPALYNCTVWVVLTSSGDSLMLGSTSITRPEARVASVPSIRGTFTW